MDFSNETQQKIKNFVKEQSQNYLEDVEMTYIEKLRKKSGQTKNKINRKLSKFKGRSDKGLEAQNDLMLYMNDYMNDLISQGLPEQEAFEKASEAMKFDSNSEQSADLNERFYKYYLMHNPAEDEAIGLFYAGFMFIGLTIGGLIGFIHSGGRLAFLSGGWIDTVIGLIVGNFIGLGISMIVNGIIVAFKKNKKKY